ncbi:hypothetical protein [Raineyella fluvialis]|uniref:Uncharacterized protein n=1 Tax=Raineyella fluvialis TaxID=2662261 RepID=A0A5Q2FE01_9ACTN|nr:hypothetical protein [Raineyella fluvialis]QGF22945.1 hypothetical protein Rai3103_03885 [Raineyella fluvialis]
MGTWIVLLITIPLVGWLTAVVVATPRRERRRVAELAEGAHARGWTYTEDASRLRPPPPQLREWQRPVMFREGFSGTYRGQEFWVAHVTYESTDPARQGRRRHATLCWLRLPFPLNDVRIVPLELLEERHQFVGGWSIAPATRPSTPGSRSSPMTSCSAGWRPARRSVRC